MIFTLILLNVFTALRQLSPIHIKRPYIFLKVFKVPSLNHFRCQAIILPTFSRTTKLSHCFAEQIVPKANHLLELVALPWHSTQIKSPLYLIDA